MSDGGERALLSNVISSVMEQSNVAAHQHILRLDILVAPFFNDGYVLWVFNAPR